MTKEGKTLVIIHATLHDEVFIKILNLETVKEEWKNEENASFELRRKFEAFKIKETENIKEFLYRLSSATFLIYTFSHFHLFVHSLSFAQTLDPILSRLN